MMGNILALGLLLALVAAGVNIFTAIITVFVVGALLPFAFVAICAVLSMVYRP